MLVLDYYFNLDGSMAGHFVGFEGNYFLFYKKVLSTLETIWTIVLNLFPENHKRVHFRSVFWADEQISQMLKSKPCTKLFLYIFFKLSQECNKIFIDISIAQKTKTHGAYHLWLSWDFNSDSIWFQSWTLSTTPLILFDMCWWCW